MDLLGRELGNFWERNYSVGWRITRPSTGQQEVGILENGTTRPSGRLLGRAIMLVEFEIWDRSAE